MSEFPPFPLLPVSPSASLVSKRGSGGVGARGRGRIRRSFIRGSLLVLLLTAPLPAAEALPIVPEPDRYGLEAVQDDSPLSHADADAYYGLLHHAGRLPQEQLRAAAKEFVAERSAGSGRPTFVDLLSSPAEFRGRPVFLRGHILQTIEYEAEENPYGIERLYEAALYTDDAQSNLTTVVFVERPDDLPLGGEMVDGIEVAGYFLKLYWYPASDKHTHRAPLILAKTVVVRPAPEFAPLVPAPVAYGLLLAGFAILVTALWRIQRSDQRRLRERRRRELDEQQPDFGSFRPEG